MIVVAGGVGANAISTFRMTAASPNGRVDLPFNAEPEAHLALAKTKKQNPASVKTSGFGSESGAQSPLAAIQLFVKTVVFS